MKLPLNGSHKRPRGPHGVLPSISRLARPRDVLIAAAVSPIHPPHDLKTISPHVVLTVAWLSLALLVPPNSSWRRGEDEERRRGRRGGDEERRRRRRGGDEERRRRRGGDEERRRRGRRGGDEKGGGGGDEEETQRPGHHAPRISLLIS